MANGRARVRQTDDDPCTCGHPLSQHGDRSVAACDGGWSDLHQVRPGATHPICECTGWSP